MNTLLYDLELSMIIFQFVLGYFGLEAFKKKDWKKKIDHILLKVFIITITIISEKQNKNMHVDFIHFLFCFLDC